MAQCEQAGVAQTPAISQVVVRLGGSWTGQRHVLNTSRMYSMMMGGVFLRVVAPIMSGSQARFEFSQEMEDLSLASLKGGGWARYCCRKLSMWSASTTPLCKVNCSLTVSAKTSALPSDESTTPLGELRDW